MKKVLIVLAAVAFAVAPCAWDVSDANDPAWITAIFAAPVTHPAMAPKDEAGSPRFDIAGTA